MPNTPLRAAAVAALAAAGLASPEAAAQDRDVRTVAITTAVPFLQIEPDSRAAGMGMTGVAIADNANAIFWNPAGLAGQEGAEVTFTHAPWLPSLNAGLYFEYLSGRYEFEGVGTFAGHVTYLNLGEQIWTNGNLITDAEGNQTVQELGRFSSGDLAVGLSYGRELGGGLSVGTGGRVIYSRLTGGQEVEGAETRNGLSFGVDLGLLYEAPAINAGGGVTLEPSFGVNLANMGPSISYVIDEGANNAIPTNLRVGTALTANLDEFNRVTFALDANKVMVDQDSTGNAVPFYEALFSSWEPLYIDTNPNDDRVEGERVGVLQQITLGAGAEYWYNDLFALRGGYFYEDPYNGNRQFITLGAGIRYSLIGIDLSYIYATEGDSPLSDQVRFSVGLNIPR